MSKPHYRLVKLRDCPDGARVFRVNLRGMLRQITVITQSPLKCQTWIHYGHEFNMRASRYSWMDYVKVWMPV